MNRIPEGLEQCPVCGEYNGSTLARNLNWEDSAFPPEPDERIGVSCRCKGPLCKQCGQRRIHRPISNSYEPKSNSIGHQPWFMGMFPCSVCRALNKGFQSRH